MNNGRVKIEMFRGKYKLTIPSKNTWVLSVSILATSILSLSSCDDPSQSNDGIATPMAKIEINLDSSQVVLTNEYAFKDGRFAKGGASFVVESKSGSVLCTAKHLLGEAMGISPKVTTSEFEQEMEYWEAFAFNKNLFKDSLSVQGLLNKKESQTDILLFKYEGKSDGLLTLKPRYSKPQINEELELIAREFNSDRQQRYPLVIDKYNSKSYRGRAKKPFNPQLMSGSPVLDKNGYVIGVLVGGGYFEDELYLTVEPLSLVKDYIE